MKAKLFSVLLGILASTAGANHQLKNAQEELIAQPQEPFNYSGYRNQVYRNSNYNYSNPYVTPNNRTAAYPYYSNPYYYYNPDIYYQSRERFIHQGGLFVDPAADPHDLENDLMYRNNLRSMRQEQQR